jgi:hypothetical protein
MVGREGVMATPARYVRVYHTILDDERFREVYDDDHALALWLRLLLLADAIWPMPAHLPHGHRRAALARLVKAGLIELVDGGRYRVHGLDAERARRIEQTRPAIVARHGRGPARGPSHVTDNVTSHVTQHATSHVTDDVTSNVADHVPATLRSGREEKRREEKRELPRAAAAALGSSRGGTSSGGPARAKPWSILRPSAAAADAARDNEP